MSRNRKFPARLGWGEGRSRCSPRSTGGLGPAARVTWAPILAVGVRSGSDRSYAGVATAGVSGITGLGRMFVSGWDVRSPDDRRRAAIFGCHSGRSRSRYWRRFHPGPPRSCGPRIRSLHGSFSPRPPCSGRSRGFRRLENRCFQLAIRTLGSMDWAGCVNRAGISRGNPPKRRDCKPSCGQGKARQYRTPPDFPYPSRTLRDPF